MGSSLARTQPGLLLAGTTLLFAGFAACSGSTRGVSATGTGGSGGNGGATSSTSTTTTSSTTSSSSSGITITTTTSDGGSGDGGCTEMGGGSCTTAAQCTNGGPNTMPTCLITDPGSEIPMGTCVYQECDSGVACSIDSTCSLADAGTVYPPYVPLYPPDVPTTCANGFEVCDAEGAPTYTIHAVPAAGSRALTLDLDFATYLAPDGLLITGIDGNCQTYVLFDSCRLQTADEAESSYTNGMERPSDVSIRQFHLMLRQGTSQLTFDFSRVVSPMYFQILGLCDFALPKVPGVGWFSLVP
jgi:hypothetical protein